MGVGTRPNNQLWISVRRMVGGVGAKSLLFFTGYGLLVLGIIGFLAHADAAKRAETLTRERLDGQTLAAEAFIGAFLNSAVQSTGMVAELLAVRVLADHITLGTGDMAVRAAADVSKILAAHLRSHPGYFQARAINARTGMEVARQERNRETREIASGVLQNKNHRGYVQDMNHLPSGVFYVSPVTLNLEQGRLEVPHRPTVRFGRIVSDAGGTPALYLVFNLDYRLLEQDLRTFLAQNPGLMVFNEDGDVLTHPNKDLPFAFETADVEPAPTAPDLVGEALWQEALETGTAFARRATVNGVPSMLALRQVRLDATFGMRKMVVGVATPLPWGSRATLSLSDDRVRIVALALLLAGSVATATMLRMVIAPLFGLIREVRRYQVTSQAVPPGRSLVTRKDELGLLARHLQDMVNRMQRQTTAAQQARNRLEAILQTAADAIIIFNQYGTIEQMNDAAERILGYSRAQLTGRNIGLLFPLDQVPAVTLDAASLAENRLPDADQAQTSLDVMVLRKDGSTFPASLAQGVFESDGQRHGSIILHDLTEVVAAREEARQANKAKSRFLANMSHELRTPLNAVTLHAQMVCDQAEEAGLEDVAEDATNIKEAADHLLDLINGILDIARIEAGRMDVILEPVSLPEFCTTLKAIAQGLARNRGNTLDITLTEAQGTVAIDRVKVRQCVLNLLSNAAKFTDNGRIGLSVAREPFQVVFKVTDTGVGMTPEQCGRVFEAFEQASSTVHGKYGGSGVGLALTRNLVELMGGSISVDSAQGVGSTFTIRLPLTEDDPPQILPAPTPIEPTVLIADDDPLARRALATLLTDEGMAVLEAESGSDVVLLARRHRPIVILLDVLMPGQDGWETLAQLRADPQTQGIPVLMISGGGCEDVSLQAGACGHLRKPLAAGELSAVLAGCRRCSLRNPVLVVEDDEAMRGALVRAIERIGLSAHACATGGEGLDSLRKKTPSAILLDLALPGSVSGFSLVETIRSTPHLKDTPVFVVTGLSLTEAEAQSVREKCSLLLFKGHYDLESLTSGLFEAIHQTSPDCPFLQTLSQKNKEGAVQ